MKFKNKIVYIILGTLLSIIILLTSVEIIAFNNNHYRNSFEKYNISSETGMDQENLQIVMKDILAYLRDQKDELDTRAVVRGEEREVFGQRERLHMVDVKELFVIGRYIRNISLLLVIILMVLVIMKDKLWRVRLPKALIYTSIFNISILAIFLTLLYFDFNKYFTYFHLIFFNNDLWILDPQTEILIQMVPEEFFFDTAVRIIRLFVGSITFLGFLGYITRNKLKRQNDKSLKEEVFS